MKSNLVGAMSLLVVVGGLSQGAQAEQSGATSYPDAVVVQERAPELSPAEQWLQIQRTGSQASTRPQLLSAQEKELANQRWLDNYTHPIPEFFDPNAGGSFTTDN